MTAPPSRRSPMGSTAIRGSLLVVVALHPATIPVPEAFLANHRFRHVQGLSERLNGSRNAGGA